MTTDEIKASVKNIEDSYTIASHSCICAAYDGEFCEGCRPDTNSFEFLLSTIKALLQCDDVMREALKELDMDCREIRISALSKNARNALAHRNKILGGLK